jgi:iron complex outermembrane recepter protein
MGKYRTRNKRVSTRSWRQALVFGAVALSFLVIDIGIASAQLEEILVTARKREESARNIPVAVTNVSGAKMDKFNLKGLEDVAELTPQVMIFRGTAGNGASINIRGIGPTTTSVGVEQSVAVILDGVYYGQGRVINEGLFDAAQIEILKGPQAVFFGKNATAGAMAIRTNDPGDELEILGRVGYETSNEEVYLEGIFSTPINDKVGIRWATRWAKQYGGYITNEANPTVYNTFDAATFTPGQLDVPAPGKGNWPQGKDFNTRLTLLFTPSDELTVRLKAYYNEYTSASTTGIAELVNCGGGNGAEPGFSQAQPDRPCTRDWKMQENPFPTVLADSNPLTNRHGGDLFDDYESYGITADADYSTDTFGITSIVNYQHLRNAWGGDYDTSDSPNVYAAEHYTYEAFSAEIRGLSSFDGPINFMLGAYHQSTTMIYDQDVIFAGAWNSAAVDPTDEYTAYEKVGLQDGSTYSVYGQVIWSIVDELEFTAGARYHNEKKTSMFEQPYVNPFFTGLFSEGRLDERQTWDDLSPEFTLTWAINDNVTVYGAYKEAFKSGGFSISGILGVISGTSKDFLFENESVAGWEGGIKASLFDNTFQIELEIYDYDFKDLQIDFFNSDVFALVTENAGSASTTGAEAQFRWAPKGIEGLLIDGTLGYNNARYGTFIAPCWSGQMVSEGCDIIIPGDVPKQDLAGFKRNLAPKWTASMTADYETPVGNGMRFGLSFNMQYRTKYSTSAFGQPDAFQGSSVILNAGVRLTSEDDRWEFAVIGKNLTNKYLMLNTGDSPGSGSPPGLGSPGIRADQRSTVNRPLSVAFQLTYRY